LYVYLKCWGKYQQLSILISLHAVFWGYIGITPSVCPSVYPSIHLSCKPSYSYTDERWNIPVKGDNYLCGTQGGNLCDLSNSSSFICLTTLTIYYKIRIKGIYLNTILVSIYILFLYHVCLHFQILASQTQAKLSLFLVPTLMAWFKVGFFINFYFLFLINHFRRHKMSKLY